MKNEFKIAMEEYVKSVERVCNNLLKELNYSENLYLKNKMDFFKYRAQSGKMHFKINDVNYKLHGIGCVAYNKNFFIDWDFGYRSRWCGIVPWKVAITFRKSKSDYIQYYDGSLIKDECERAVLAGAMFKKYGQYYFCVPDNETFKPKFPQNFDTLLIKYFDREWLMPKNKIIDRFIRKSTKIYNQISESEDKYILKFLLKGEEVYSIAYNDICYPENAVKIMSDVILQNLLKK